MIMRDVCLCSLAPRLQNSKLLHVRTWLRFDRSNLQTRLHHVMDTCYLPTSSKASSIAPDSSPNLSRCRRPPGGIAVQMFLQKKVNCILLSGDVELPTWLGGRPSCCAGKIVPEGYQIPIDQISKLVVVCRTRYHCGSGILLAIAWLPIFVLACFGTFRIFVRYTKGTRRFYMAHIQ